MPALHAIRNLLMQRHALYLAALIALTALGWRYLSVHRVQGIHPMAHNIVLPLKGAGELAARNEAQLASKTTLKVNALLTEVGQSVQRGQPLLVLDSTELEVQVKALEAALLAAHKSMQAARLTQLRTAAIQHQTHADARRAHELAGRGSGAISQTDLEAAALTARVSQLDSEVSQAQWQVAQQTVLQAERNLDAARIRVHEATVRAPFDGIVTDRHCSVGDTLNPGTACMTVIELGSLFVSARFDESALGEIDIGDSVSVHLKSQSLQAIGGRIERVNRAVDPDTREFTVDIAMDELPRGWALGERALITLGHWSRPVALAIPVNYLVSTRKTHGVWIARDGRAHWAPLRLGMADSQYVEIIGGLDRASVVLEPTHLSRWLRVEPLLEP